MRFLTPRLGLLLVFPLVAGCAPKSGKVSGRVTYKGNPIPAGWINFRPADPGMNALSAELDADGNYAIDLPAGEVTVSIDNREFEPRARSTAGGVPAGIPLPPEIRAQLGAGKAAPAPAADPRPAPPSGKYVPIPEKYYSGETSGLKFAVKGGSQTQNFDLTD